MNAFKYTDYHVQQRGSQLVGLMLALMELEQNGGMTHRDRNHFITVLTKIAKELQDTLAPSEGRIDNIPF